MKQHRNSLKSDFDKKISFFKYNSRKTREIALEDQRDSWKN